MSDVPLCVAAESLAQQVQNPATLFAADNNGVIVELPAVSVPETSVSGSLVFGIGTQANNGLNGGGPSKRIRSGSVEWPG